MEGINKTMEVIHEPMKIIPGDHTCCLPNNSPTSYDCKTNLALRKHLFQK